MSSPKLKPFALALVALASSAANALPGNVPPARTWVFAVGVLKFQNSELASWSGAHRRDAQLVQYFKDQGVPADHIVYLSDSQATSTNIRAQMPRLLARSGAGDSLFVYYTGHGGQESNGVGTFSTYDKGAWWNQDDLVGCIEKSFHGSRAFMLADCCESGRLADAAKRAKGPPIDYFVLTSSSPNEHGNGHWTFSQGVLDALRGAPSVDVNGDGKITLTDLATYMRDEMAALEETRTCCLGQGVWGGDTPVAAVRPSQHPIPERVLVRYKGSLYRAKVVARKGDQARIRWTQIGYDTPDHDEWVPASTVSVIRLKNRLRKGQKVRVESEGRWYPGQILDTDRGLCLVSYDGYQASSNEWVGESRLKTR